MLRTISTSPSSEGFLLAILADHLRFQEDVVEYICMKSNSQKYAEFQHEVGKDVLRALGFTLFGIPAILAGFVFLGVWGWATLAVIMYAFFNGYKR